MTTFRRISAHEYAQGGMLLWWAIALARTPDSLRASNPLYRQMTDMLPFWCWIVAPLALMVGLLAASLTGRARELGWCVVTVAAWWTLIAYLLWSVSRTYVTPGFAAVFAVAAMARFGELRARP